jgi:HK97 family phage portal protein
MGIIDAFLNRRRENIAALEYRSASAGGQVIPSQSGRPQWLPRTIDAYDGAAYRKVVLIYRCVQEIAAAAGTASLQVINPESEEADDTHPLRQLIVQPNEGMGEGRFLSFITMNMAVTNFVVIEKERDALGNVIALWPLRSDWIRPIPINQAPPDWEYRVPGREPIRLKSEDVIPIPYADTPDNSPTGIGPMESVLREAQISSALTDFLKVFMDRGAMPLYAVIPQDEGPGAAQWKKQETKDAFIEAFKKKYMGLGNAGEPLPMVGVKDVKQIGFDFNQLAYTDLNNLQDARICTAFGVPPILVGAQVGLERSTFSNTAEARTSFYEDTMSYVWSRIDDAFTRHLLPEFEWRPGWSIQFDTSNIPALQDDRNEANTRAVAAFTAGLISRHPAQIEAGYDVHGPDDFLIPFNMLPTPTNAVTALPEATVEVESEGERMYREFLRRLNIYALPTHDPKAPRYVMREGRKYVNEYRLSPAEREQRAAVVQTNQTTIGRLASVIEPHRAEPA